MRDESKPKRKKRPRGWREKAIREAPYDPLKLENLGRSIELRMLEMKPEPITDVPIMIGAGIYAIYYIGDHELYRPISEPYCQTPIYVGKATPEGGRKGGRASVTDDEDALWARIREHSYSLEEARDLDVADFRVRYLVAVDVFVSLAEQVMIRQFRPVWNSVVDGFGNHAPGSGRGQQARPPWDDLHPGRSWSTPEKMAKPSRYTALESKIRVVAHWKQQGLLPEDAPLPTE